MVTGSPSAKLTSFQWSRPLCQGDILARLEPASRAELERRCTARRVSAGTVLFAQGEPHTETFFLQNGLVRTFYLSPSGKEITLAFWSAGDLIGGPDFFGDSPHIWSARCVKDTSLLAVAGPELRALTRAHPDLCECVVDALAFKTHWLSVLLQSLTTECVTDRLAHQLVLLCSIYGVEDKDGIAIRHEFTQEDLAGMVGATRQWVSMVLNQLQRAGLIRVRNRHLVIRDPDALMRFGHPDRQHP